MTARRVGLAEAKAKFSAIVDGVAHRGERYVVERHGKGVAALVSVEDLEVIERLRAGADRPAGAMALVALWHDVADEEIDALVDILVRTRAGDASRPVELAE